MISSRRAWAGGHRRLAICSSENFSLANSYRALSSPTLVAYTVLLDLKGHKIFWSQLFHLASRMLPWPWLLEVSRPSRSSDWGESAAATLSCLFRRNVQ